MFWRRKKIPEHYYEQARKYRAIGLDDFMTRVNMLLDDDNLDRKTAVKVIDEVFANGPLPTDKTARELIRRLHLAAYPLKDTIRDVLARFPELRHYDVMVLAERQYQ